MKKYFIKLKKQGYYIRKRKGEFNGKIFTDYMMIKDNPTPDSNLIACWLNKSAVKKMIKEIGFKMVFDDKNTVCFLQTPECLKFETQTKEPLIRW